MLNWLDSLQMQHMRCVGAYECGRADVQLRLVRKRRGTSDLVQWSTWLCVRVIGEKKACVHNPLGQGRSVCQIGEGQRVLVMWNALPSWAHVTFDPGYGIHSSHGDTRRMQSSHVRNVVLGAVRCACAFRTHM